MIDSPSVKLRGLLETGATGKARALRAAGVAIAWSIACLPLVFGKAHCAMAQTLGIPCPGCGMTRAMLMLGRGDVVGSLRMHPMAVPNALAALLAMVATVWVTALDGSPMTLLRRKIGRIAIAALIAVQVAILGVWIARMLGALGGAVAV